MMKTLKQLTILLLIALTAGCSGGDQPAASFGFRGSVPGRFASPRGIAVHGDLLYVIDRTGRVQAYNQKGEYQYHWQLPKYDNGTPTGIDIDDEGNVWIPDTHNSRLLKYSKDGELLFMFGENGEEPGKFQFLTDVAVGPDGNLYISEYGVVDRIQVFSPQGKYLKHWGAFGEGEEDFQRPMAVVYDGDQLLYIADTVNNRIKACTLDGQLSHMFGEPGENPGQFSFPYDLDVGEDGNIYTLEWSGHRVQKWSAKGEWLGSWGSVGSGASQLSEPWGISLTSENAFVADTLNHRIQIIPLKYIHS
jgi:DNA-binding beta-propeller fold protein YncE